MAGNSESVSKGWLKRPHSDPQKRKQYHEVYSRTEKGSASLKAAKRRYWDKLKADPIRLERWNNKIREAMRLRRLRAKANADEKPRERIVKPKPPRPDRKPKPMKPLDVHRERKKIWVSARHKPLFVENGKTIKRGRPRKVKKVIPHCDHNQGFKFKMTELGMKRTCNSCGRSFTEVARPI